MKKNNDNKLISKYIIDNNINKSNEYKTTNEVLKQMEADITKMSKLNDDDSWSKVTITKTTMTSWKRRAGRQKQQIILFISYNYIHVRHHWTSDIVCLLRHGLLFPAIRLLISAFNNAVCHWPHTQQFRKARWKIWNKISIFKDSEFIIHTAMSNPLLWFDFFYEWQNEIQKIVLKTSSRKQSPCWH